MSGYIKLYREIQKNKYWREKPYSKGQAWVDLLMRANHADNGVYKKGHVYTSLRILANDWGWSKNKVSLFLADLEASNMVKKSAGQKKDEKGTEKRTTKGTVLAIVKWDFFQDTGDSKKDSKRDKKGTKKGYYQEDKKKEESTLPSKEGERDSKKMASLQERDDEYFRKMLRDEEEMTPQELMEAVRRGLMDEFVRI